ncbi:hypothetical protein RMR10_006160 [Agrobacterium rosae]|uniref:hypothetical protein n=1 Tax=Agrobacterium rosae TaxID=1972867 RepID=UPI002A120999|nr:hypothetical protein [Agrobacterium rosae]MDX8317091.1 hypothetical protein [Agrobacterium rosae]
MNERLPEAALKALIQTEQRGDVSVLRTLLASIGNDIANEGNIDEVRDFSHLLMRMTELIEYEAIAGEGALMNWKHPENISMLEAGLFRNRFPHRIKG